MLKNMILNNFYNYHKLKKPMVFPNISIFLISPDLKFVKLEPSQNISKYFERGNLLTMNDM